MFGEADRASLPAERVGSIRGVARLLPSWPGAGAGRYPVQIDVERGALYWDAPEKVEGVVEIAGQVSSNDIDAPDGFPATTGVVRRILMEWREFVEFKSRSWRNEGGRARYEKVPATYFPVGDHEPTGAALGATKTVWTGVLIELETTGLVDE
jgi:hypothetical protein